MKRLKKRSGSTRIRSSLLRCAAAALLAVLCTGCAQKPIRDEIDLADRYHPVGKERIRGMLESLAAANKKAPATLSAEFVAVGSFSGKNYRVSGFARFDRGKNALEINFTDAIFRSPLATVVQEGDEIRIYYPAEKRLYIENSNTIDLARYGVAGIDFKIIHRIITGAIPLLDRHVVKRGLAANQGSETLLILENLHYYQTISFEGEKPRKILLVNRGSGERFEAYLKKPIERDGAGFFGAITISAPQARLSVDITFSKVVLNAPITIKRAKEIPIHPSTTIIKI